MVGGDSSSIDIFSALSNSVRIEILRHLNDSSMLSSKLAKKMNTTVQANQKHLTKLTKCGMVTKGHNGSLELTPIAKASLAQISSFTFFSKFKDYFLEHSLEGVPDKLIQRTGDLCNCTLIEDPMAAWEHAKNTIENCKEFLYGASTMIPIEFYAVVKKRFKHVSKFRIIYQKNATVAKGFSEDRKKTGWLDQKKKGIVEEKSLPNLPLTIVVTKNTAEVLFANKKTGQIDGNMLFVSSDPKFCQWCTELFNYYWSEVPGSSEISFHEV
jgi:predicted transcriptional regulator